MLDFCYIRFMFSLCSINQQIDEYVVFFGGNVSLLQ